jgi:hypothetical protein
VIDKAAKHLGEVVAFEDQEPVETFSTGGVDEAPCERVRRGRAPAS